MGSARDVFASAAVSLVHPVLMIVVCSLWIYAWVLGLGVRRRRKADSGQEAILLLSGGGGSAPPRGRIHHKLAAALLFATVFLMSFGMLNTYARTSRLFPGPHLYGGFALVCLLSLQAALAPWLRETTKARLVHTVVGGCAIVAVASQVWSGVGILRSLVAGFGH